VRSGQTLSEIAARELPDLAVSDGVVELQLANALSTSQVRAGQTLLIPAR
jgi:LysM repeat protein